MIGTFRGTQNVKYQTWKNVNNIKLKDFAIFKTQLKATL